MTAQRPSGFGSESTRRCFSGIRRIDLLWLKDASLEDSENLPAPEVLAREILEDLAAAVLFEEIAQKLEKS